jgi:hypothetical protein
MTPRITLITALAAAALVVAVPPAFADPWGADQQERADFWNYDENGTKVTDTSPGMSASDVAQLYSGAGVGQPQWRIALDARSEGLNRIHGLGKYASLRALEIRSEALNMKYGLGAYATSTSAIDARERALGPERHLGATPMLDARERAFEVKQVPASVPTDTRPVVGDGGDRFRIDPTSTPVAVGSIDSGREIEWPQIGFGVGIGVLFALGLMFLIRTTRSRELAH